MGILDSLKKVVKDSAKKTTTTKSTPPAASTPNAAAAAKAAALVGSKVTTNQQSNIGSKELSRAEVEAVIEARVKEKGMQHANWKVSIVDLMTVLDMNSSLASRKALAARLNYSGNDADGSAEKNKWLHAELLKALAKNGGKVPSNLV